MFLLGHYISNHLNDVSCCQSAFLKCFLLKNRRSRSACIYFLYKIKSCVLSIFTSNITTCYFYTMLRLSYYFIFKQCQDLCVFCLYTMTRPVCYLFVYNVKTCVLSVFLYNVKTCVCVLSVFYTMSRHVWYLFLYNVKTGVISIFMKCQDLCANVLSIL